MAPGVGVVQVGAPLSAHVGEMANNRRARREVIVKLKNLEFLLDGHGEVTLGRVGPVRCAAVACDEDQQLAALVRDRGESMEALLVRLDAAVGKALEDEEFVDEING